MMPPLPIDGRCAVHGDPIDSSAGTCRYCRQGNSHVLAVVNNPHGESRGLCISVATLRIQKLITKVKKKIEAADSSPCLKAGASSANIW